MRIRTEPMIFLAPNDGGGGAGATADGGGSAGASSPGDAGAGGAALSSAPSANGAAGANGGGDFLASLPEDIRGNPAFEGITDVGSLAQKVLDSRAEVVGFDKLIGKRWGELEGEELQTVYGRLGRPENAEGYTLSFDELPEGVAVDDNFVGKFRAGFHDLGLRQEQAAGLSKIYEAAMVEAHTAQAAAAAEMVHVTAQTLETDWGQAHGKNLAHANAGISYLSRETGSDVVAELKQFGLLAEDGSARAPGVVKALALIGEKLGEGSGAGTLTGQGAGGLMTPKQAEAEIGLKKRDEKFMEALNTKDHPGHKAALEEWENLHKFLASGDAG